MALRSALCRRISLSSSFPPIIFGILLGYLIGKSLLSDSETAAQPHLKVFNLHNQIGHRIGDSHFSLRCVILIDSGTPKRELFVQAIQDTWGIECNNTVFFTTENAKYYSLIPDISLISMNSNLNAFFWALYRQVLERLNESNYEWTLIADEQLFAVVSNLRKSLSSIDSTRPVMVGRVSLYKPPLASILPFIESSRISHQAGIAFTQSSIKLLSECSRSILPRSTEKTLLECARIQGVSVIDPVDEEGQRIFHQKTLLSLIPVAYEGKSGEQVAGCCSDHSATFGSMSFKEQRVAHFASVRMRVFGVSGVKRMPLNGTVTD